MAYKALYREWRPKNFQEVIGQDHISITLQNAVEHGRIAHAYLFSGPRGTGKTSSAKVLAKALNCEHGPTPEPCNECDHCLRINNGSSMDVIEIDAASNRGIEDIRDLREKVKFAATEGRYKIYIIDEVHMLTPEAFNALLKTLEEPPDQVVFILATTEPHKIPATILSRVQRFDFKRISVPKIVGHLKTVVADFSQEVDEDALLLIARKADGGMRDALGLLDQCYSTGEKLTVNKVVQVLGTLREEDIYFFCENLIEGDALALITRLNDLILEGKECAQIVREVVEHLRNLLLLQAAKDTRDLIHVTQETWDRILLQSKKISINRLSELITLFIKTEGEIKNSTQPRVTLEVTLIKACSGDKGSTPQRGQSTEQTQRIEQTQSIKQSQSIEQTKQEPKGKKSKDKEKPTDRKKTAAGQPQNSFSAIMENWETILDAVKKTSVSTHALLVEGSPIGVSNDVLAVGFKPKSTFHRDKVNQPENKKLVEQAVFSILGYPIGINCITMGETRTASESSDDLIGQTYQVFPEELVEIKD